MAELWTNNAEGTLNGSITDVATSLAVQAGEGALLPNPTGGDYFYLSIENEILKCTARSTDSLTVVRAQQGTSGAAHADDVAWEHRWTAGSATALQQQTVPVAPGNRWFKGLGTPSSTVVWGSGLAHFVYLGRVTRPLTIKYVLFRVSSAGVGSQAAEVGIFSSPLAPNRAGQTLTKLWADGTLQDLTSGTGIRGNASASTTEIAADTHIWGGVRIAMGSTQPTVAICGDDWLSGNILSAAAPGALTGIATVAGSLLGGPTNSGLDIRASLD